MSNILISISGDCTVERNQLKNEYEHIFGVDGGTEYLYKLFLQPTQIIGDFDSIDENTKIIFIESPSNPLLKVIDLEAIGNISKKYNLISIIDNTFASPINQNPANFGIDIIIHSATKYLGGHSDICAGAIASSQVHIDKIWNLAKNLGGSLSEYAVWLLERSMKTLG